MKKEEGRMQNEPMGIAIAPVRPGAARSTVSPRCA
jgi:hypothetical protein